MLYSENGNNINMRLTISVTGKIPEVRKNPFRNSLKKGQVYFRFNTNSKEARVCVCVCVGGGVPYDVFKGLSPKWGLVRRGHCIILSKVSNYILTGFTDQGNTWVTIFYIFLVILKKIIHANRH